ncbi:MAG: hypothetical protein ACJ75J_13380, partial [Cytophagaceae bacterium]
MRTNYTLILMMIVLITLGICPYAFAQTNAASSRTAKSAETYFQNKQYKHALMLYLDMEKAESCDAELNYKIGICYLNTAYKHKALSYFHKALSLGNTSHEFIDMDYYLGCSYHLNNEFSKAIIHYTKFRNTLNTSDPSEAEEIKAINRFIENCHNGIALLMNPGKATIEHLPLTINTGFADLHPIINPTEDQLFFASRRHNSTEGNYDPSTHEYNEDIFVSKKENGKWTFSTHLHQNLKDIYNEVPSSVSPDGKKLFLNKTDHHHDFDIYYSMLEGEEWSAPVSMGDNINSPDHERGGCISPDGQSFYFCSDRPGGFGGMDIYISRLQSNGEWGPAKNMGAQVNTRYDEEYPSISADGKRIYFSSEGHNSIGGFDLFVSGLDQKRQIWTQAKNLGMPINTPDDEMSITFTKDEKHAYYSARHN